MVDKIYLIKLNVKDSIVYFFMAIRIKTKNSRLIIRSSTWSFIKEGRRTHGYTFLDWLHGYIYARWPYLYIGIGVGEHPLSTKLAPLWSFFERVFLTNWEETTGSQQERITFADSYHGKVVPLEAARQLVMVNEEIRLTNLEKIIPYARARDIILKNPDHIIALECPCRSARAEPCLPLDVCLIVGEPFASFVADHHPRRSRWITSEEAAEILRAEDVRGHVHHAFFKDAMLGRFYAICNCCSCCCGAMQAHQGGTPMLAASGYTSQVNPELCIACGDCVEVCQFGSLQIEDGIVLVDQRMCMGCGVCVSHCEQGALELVRDSSKGEPLEIFKLYQAASERSSYSYG
jgi:NAD-dependent dihydropyrimidine dehydrogenase PreA subunit